MAEYQQHKAQRARGSNEEPPQRVAAPVSQGQQNVINDFDDSDGSIAVESDGDVGQSYEP